MSDIKLFIDLFFSNLIINLFISIIEINAFSISFSLKYYSVEILEVFHSSYYRFIPNGCYSDWRSDMARSIDIETSIQAEEVSNGFGIYGGLLVFYSGIDPKIGADRR